MSGRGASMAGASARARYRALRAQQRQERAVARLVVSGVAGSMAAGLLGWLPGVAVGVGLLLAHLLYFRVRPCALTAWRRGAAAERRTGRRLSRLDPAYFHVLHDRALPGGLRVNLDHLVVGHTGVYAISSRRWPPLTRLRADGRLWAGPRRLTRLPVRARRAASVVADRIAAETGREVEVSPVIAVHGGRLPRGGILFDGVLLHRAERVNRLIERQPVLFTTAEVAAIAAAAERILPPMIDI
ncbi:NERD domain-containing protein [Actinoallomurus purpureus]|uniref:nuclease-related domain-containing protein n=1 Tax=Actinoallomurus purpureus TaxID=478114 RepID=UPI002093EF76|nr:nuclease-related domain-containing protein [Actinoallomurus purpureus]MCO6004254.1 NERD domain-containing protein [Actinoallomurus purpureus]